MSWRSSYHTQNRILKPTVGLTRFFYFHFFAPSTLISPNNDKPVINFSKTDFSTTSKKQFYTGPCSSDLRLELAAGWSANVRTSARFWSARAAAPLSRLTCELFQKPLLAIVTTHRTNPMSNEASQRKAIRDSENFWQLDGESILNTLTIPDPPKPNSPVTIRLTLSNSYGPLEEVEFFVRLGNPDHPTDPKDLDSARDWIKTSLVEELVDVDGEEMLRSQTQEPFEDETQWEGTFEAQMTIPAGRHTIEIKILSPQPDLQRSMVLNDWEINVG
jgi:hypothetical protein